MRDEKTDMDAAFPPDSVLVASVVPSPNRNERRGVEAVDMLVLHYTGMPGPASDAVARLCDLEAQVSAHYLVDETGHITQMVPEKARAWHAGKGRWRGFDDINSRSIGIEIHNPGHEWGYQPFPGEQVAAVAGLCREICSRHPIPERNVIAHSDMAPDRKEDPGELFPWERLFRVGVGLWVPPEPVQEGAAYKAGDEGLPVRALQMLFAYLGYDLPPTGIFDKLTEEVVRAFQRHFRQDKVDGVADVSTVRTLKGLVDRV